MLRADPGEWYLVAVDASRSNAWRIKRGENRHFLPPEDYRVRTVGPRGPRGDIYVAFVGVPGALRKAELNAR